jgi:glutathione S-transferase
LKDGEFTLFESHTMLRYLHQTRKVNESWYPNDPVKRARVNEYLDWHHLFLRQGSDGYAIEKLYKPFVKQRKRNEQEV